MDRGQRIPCRLELLCCSQICSKLALPLRLLDEGLKGILLELAEASERIIINSLRVETDGDRGGVL
jgi:hypothetical protein